MLSRVCARGDDDDAIIGDDDEDDDDAGEDDDDDDDWCFNKRPGFIVLFVVVNASVCDPVRLEAQHTLSTENDQQDIHASVQKNNLMARNVDVDDDDDDDDDDDVDIDDDDDDDEAELDLGLA